MSILLYPAAIHVWGPLVILSHAPAIVAFCLLERSGFAMALAWVTGTLSLFLVQHTLWVVTLPGTAWLSCYQGLVWIPMAFGVRSLWKLWRIPLTFSWPLAWCAGEAICMQGPLGTNFGTLAVPETTTLWMLQIVDLAGAPIAAFPLAMTQGWLSDAFLAWMRSSSFRDRRWARMLQSRLGVACLALVSTWGGVAGYGFWRIRDVQSDLKPGPALSVVATDILALPNGESSYDPGLLLEKIKQFSQAASESSPKPELIFWPEGMLGNSIPNLAFLQAPFDPRMRRQLSDSNGIPLPEEQLKEQWERMCQENFKIEANFQTWVHSLQTPVMVGMDAWLPSPKEQVEPFELRNAAVWFDPDKGQSPKIQSKCRLYPFGEYAPWKGSFLEPWFNRWIGPPRRQYQPGNQREIFSLKDNGPRFVVSLCSELKFNHLDGMREGSGHSEKPFDFMVNMANEGLFMRNGMPEIFAFCATLRAIENRVTVVRSSNAGVSGFWSPTGSAYGQVTHSNGQTQSGHGAPEVPLIESLIEFRRQNETAFSHDPAKRRELQRRIDEIESIRKLASVEGWSAQPIYLSSKTTLFQRYGDKLTPVLTALLGLMNLAGIIGKRWLPFICGKQT